MSSISGSINHGITLGPPNYSSPLTITSSGYVSNNGTGAAIYGVTGTVVNQGTLNASGTSIFGGYFGIEIDGDGSVDNSGTIITESAGVAVYGNGSVTNSGTITAQEWGVEGRQFLAITNTGTIYGVDDGVDLFGGGFVTNSNTIIGANGVDISGSAGTVDNSGSIVGTYGNAIDLAAGGSVSNSAPGMVYGSNVYTGIYIGGGAGSIVNSGSINGYAGVVFSGTYNNTLIDSGTIIGRGGVAIQFAAGDDLLTLQPGSLLITGTVDGGGGTNTLEFASAAIIGTLTGGAPGADFVNFSNATVDSNALWVLAGGITLGATTTLTVAGDLKDSGSLNNYGSIAVGLGTHLLVAPGGYLRNDASGRITGILGHATGSEAPAISGLNGGASTVVNLGTISDPQFSVGIDLNAGGVVRNGGAGSTVALISGVTYGIEVSGGIGTVTNFGTITGTGFGIDLADGGTISDAGTIIGGGGTAISFGGSSSNLLILNAGYAITGMVSGSVSASNTLELASAASTGSLAGLGSEFIGFEQVVIDPGASWALSGNNSFTGGIAIDAGATLDLEATSAAGSGVVTFDGSAELRIAGGIAVGNTIDGFSAGDSFDFRGIAPGADTTATLNLSSNVLTVTDGIDTQTLSLDPTQNFVNPTWTVVADGAGGVAVACYCRGTRIATPGGEAAIETLRIGDLVRTHAGLDRPVKWIGRRSYTASMVAANPQLRPLRIRAGALADGVPSRDLEVSPEHALLIGGALVPARHLVNGASIVPVYANDPVIYLHIELADHDVILAEGQPAETFVDCDSRAMFENVAEFAALYPNDAAAPWMFCAARLEHGEALADIRHAVNMRAGIADADWRHDSAPGRLTGNLEVVSGEEITGWAQDAAAPERPVRLEIVSNGEVVARVLANRYRRDLEQAGLGSGRHAFSVRQATPRLRRFSDVIEVRRAADRASLPGSPADSNAAPYRYGMLMEIPGKFIPMPGP